MVTKSLKQSSYNFIVKQKNLKGHEMKKNILVAVALVGTLATGAFAYNHTQGNCDDQTIQMQQKGMHKHMRHNKDGMRMFSQLNLTSEQKYQLSILKDEMRLQMKKSRGYSKQNKIMQFVSDNGFDKEAFKKAMSEDQSKQLELRADFMEKAFNILTKEQVTKLKTLAAK
jgi:Spy/CpxP family protein refolding chaperone